MLNRMLELDGHEVLQAGSWKEALKCFGDSQPEMAFLGQLADSNGNASAAELKALAPNRFVPVLLSTSISDHCSLARFLESGADDFIDPPYSHIIIKAKIANFERVRELYRKLEKFRSTTEQEIKLAQHMFNAVTHKRPAEPDFIHHWTLAAGHFCGDLMIFERTPDNHLHILLGDFTGHGLAAAVGALPTSDIFFAMTRKGFGIHEIAREINRKLHKLLPTGQFCAASLVSISPDAARLEIWNGGLPPVLLINGQREILHEFPSSKLPLGVVGDDGFDASSAECSLGDIHHIILYSDGLVEAQNANGKEFGGHGLASALRVSGPAGSLLDLIKNGVIEFLDGLEPHDDISLLSINLGAAC